MPIWEANFFPSPVAGVGRAIAVTSWVHDAAVRGPTTAPPNAGRAFAPPCLPADTSVRLNAVRLVDDDGLTAGQSMRSSHRKAARHNISVGDRDTISSSRETAIRPT